MFVLREEGSIVRGGCMFRKPSDASHFLGSTEPCCSSPWQPERPANSGVLERLRAAGITSPRVCRVSPHLFHPPSALPLSLQSCITIVEKWLLENCGIILGICVGVAVVEVFQSRVLVLLETSVRGSMSSLC